jgi:hypothetical protein
LINHQKSLFLTFCISIFATIAHAETIMHDHAMQSMTNSIDMPMDTHGFYGLYPMMREVSGTSWQPQSTPFTGLMVMSGKNRLMAQGFINQIYDNQGGPRGGKKNFSTSMFMFMVQRDLAVGTLGFRNMYSLDPLMGPSGYPLLLQTGETANGHQSLIDRQHPHDIVMEFAGTYSIPFAENKSVFLYMGLVGEPALGPPVFMMRWSGLQNPEAPITHHWLDSTHTTYGVVTLGYTVNKIKLEISAFNGREPDQNRWTLEPPKLNSESVRISYNPDANISLQASYGHLQSPEQLHSDVNTNRATISAIYNKPFGVDNNWQTTVAWGQNKNLPGHTLNGYMLEAAVDFHLTHTFFGRLEHVQKDELFEYPSPYTDQVFTVNKLSIGYLYEFPTWHFAKPGLGALVSAYALPTIVRSAYGGGGIFSYMLFGRLSIA